MNGPRRKPGPLFALDDPVLDDPSLMKLALDGFGGKNRNRRHPGLRRDR